MKKIKRLTTDGTHKTPMPLTEALAVAAGGLTAAYAGNVGSWIDTADIDTAVGTDCYDNIVLQLAGSGSVVMSGVKLFRVRMALTNDDPTGTPSNIDYYMEDGRVKEWEVDTFGAAAGGTNGIILDTIKMTHRAFRLEAKCQDGTYGATEEFLLNYALINDNAWAGPDMLAKIPRRPYRGTLRAYTILTAAWSDRVYISTADKKFLSLLFHYVEGESSTGGALGIMIEKIMHDESGNRISGEVLLVDQIRVLAGAVATADVAAERYSWQHDNYELADTAGSWTGGVATLAVGAGHTFRVGDKVTIRGVSPSGYNGDNLLITAITATQISYAVAADPGAWASAGLVRRLPGGILVFDEISQWDEVSVSVCESGDTAHLGDCKIDFKATEA